MRILYCRKRIFIILLLSVMMLVSCESEETGKVPITTQSKLALKYFLKGRDFMDRLHYAEAKEYMDKAIAEDPDFALAYLHRAHMSFGRKEFNQEMEKALALVDKVSTGEKLKILGLEAFANRLPMKEREYYQKLVVDYPNDERVHLLLGNNYFFQGDYNQAIGEYRRATEINPKFSLPYNQLGYSHRYLENYEEAENAFKAYIKLNPDDPNPYDSYADLLMKMGNFEKSIKTFEQALKRDPNFSASHIGIANNLNLLGQHEKARQLIHEVVNQTDDPMEIRYYKFTIALSFFDEGLYDQGLEVFEIMYNSDKVSRDLSRMVEDLIFMGDVQRHMGAFDQAHSNYQFAYELMEDSGFSVERKMNSQRTYFYRKALLAIEQNDITSAKDFTLKFKQSVEGLKDRNRTSQYHELLGHIALGDQNYDEALGEFRRASLHNPNIFLQMAIAASKMGDRLKAIKFCEKAAHFNGINNLNYALIRLDATQFLEKLKNYD